MNQQNSTAAMMNNPLLTGLSNQRQSNRKFVRAMPSLLMFEYECPYYERGKPISVDLQNRMTKDGFGIRKVYDSQTQAFKYDKWVQQHHSLGGMIYDLKPRSYKKPNETKGTWMVDIDILSMTGLWAVSFEIDSRLGRNFFSMLPNIVIGQPIMMSMVKDDKPNAAANLLITQDPNQKVYVKHFYSKANPNGKPPWKPRFYQDNSPVLTKNGNQDYDRSDETNFFVKQIWNKTVHNRPDLQLGQYYVAVQNARKNIPQMLLDKIGVQNNAPAVIVPEDEFDNGTATAAALAAQNTGIPSNPNTVVVPKPVAAPPVTNVAPPVTNVAPPVTNVAPPVTNVAPPPPPVAATPPVTSAPPPVATATDNPLDGMAEDDLPF